MSEPRRSTAQPPSQDGSDPLLAWVESLRTNGAWRLDPARFHYMEALSRRIPGQTEPVRRLLQDKLQAALAEYAERLAKTQPAASKEAARAGPAASCVPLAQLNHYIRGVPRADDEATSLGEAQEPVDELASVRRFRRVWCSSRTQDRVAQAASRKPANAGPLNSHVLVLHSLALMQELSADYLRRFLVHVESLQWLDQISQDHPKQHAKQAKPARRSRSTGRASSSKDKT